VTILLCYYKSNWRFGMKVNILGRNISILRKKLGFSQDDIAKLLYVDRSTVSKYESEARNIPIEHLEKIANFLGVELYILFEENEKMITEERPFAFRKKDMHPDDFNILLDFQKIVSNYIKMNRLVNSGN